MHIAAFPTSMAKPEIVVLIPESTRKARGGSSDAPEVDSIAAAVRQAEPLVARPRPPRGPRRLSRLDPSPTRRRPPFPGVPAVGHRVRRRPQGDRRSDDRLSRDRPRKPATSRGTHRPDSAIRNLVAQPAIGASGLSGPPRPVDGSRPAPRRGTG